MTPTTQTPTHQSKWGHHNCSYQQYRELKHYHQLLLHAYRDSRRLARWTNKTVHRHGPQPTCPPSTTNPTHTRHLYLTTLQEYRNARHPHPTPDQVTPLQLHHNWQHHHHQLQQHYTQ